jgi:V-type H+-transporting ATPase subunit e
MSGFLVVVWALVSLGLGSASWFLTPKGANQTYVARSCAACRVNVCSYQATHSPLLRLLRTSLMLAITCCYLLWAITYMSQLHPLIGQCCALADESLGHWIDFGVHHIRSTSAKRYQTGVAGTTE